MFTENFPVLEEHGVAHKCGPFAPYSDLSHALHRLQDIGDALILRNLALILNGQALAPKDQAHERALFMLSHELQTRIDHLIVDASTCALTGVLNYRAIMTSLANEFARAVCHNTPLGVVMLDLDKFRDFNQKLGHIETNKCVAKIGGILKHRVRTSDLVGRFGGDEFLVICPSLSESEVMAHAVRLCKTIANHPFPLLSVTISVGVASLLPADANPAMFLERANRALRCVKATGRGFALTWDTKMGWPTA